MTESTCPYCERPYADTRGCEYVEGDPMPKVYGAELHPLSSTPTCRDCAAPKDTLHHAACLCSECPKCDGQFGLCGGTDCESARVLTTGVGA